MSYTPEILNKKLSTLNETQESIVTISHWIIFHHRYAETTAQLWSEYINNAPSQKKLMLLYLCNDVVQQARAKRKTEFTVEFGKVLPLVIFKTYQVVSDTVKGKIDRLMKVWQERNIFPTKVINDLKESVEKTKFQKSSAPSADSNTGGITAKIDKLAPELIQLSTLYNGVSSTSSTNLSYLSKVTTNYNQLFESENLPSPKIYLSKLNILEKLCNMGLNGINENISLRQEIIKTLERMTLMMKENIEKEFQKKQIIDEKLLKVMETSIELKEMVDEETPQPTSAASNKPTFALPNLAVRPKSKPKEEPSPALDSESEDDLPMYDENSSGEEDEPLAKKTKIESYAAGSNSASNSNSITPEPPKVQFSDNIQIETIETENQLRDDLQSDSDASDADIYNTTIPRDDLSLKRKHDEEENLDLLMNSIADNNTDGETDEYDPSDHIDGQSDFSNMNNELKDSETNVNEFNGLNPDVMSLLSKLANN